ncbi:MAG: hypothetical protein ABIH35_01690 [Patescibacteria group bacterium]
MDLPAFLSLLRRNWITICIVMLATLLASSVIYILQPPAEKTTLLYSAGIAADSSLERGTETTKLADDFARTITGWTRSSTFSEKVSGISGTVVNVSGVPQAKQNFLITLAYASPENADRITAAAKQVFADELAKYNENSKLKFFITLHGESRAPDRASLGVTSLAALVGGALLAIAWIILHAYFGERVNSISEAEKILRQSTSVTFRNLESPDLKFLGALLKKTGGNAILVGADVNLKILVEKLGGGIHTARVPKEANALTKNDAKPIIVVRLDHTRASTLRQLQALMDKEIKLAVWG